MVFALCRQDALAVEQVGIRKINLTGPAHGVVHVGKHHVRLTGNKGGNARLVVHFGDRVSEPHFFAEGFGKIHIESRGLPLVIEIVHGRRAVADADADRAALHDLVIEVCPFLGHGAAREEEYGQNKGQQPCGAVFQKIHR